jgi:hypothetical protein
VNLTTPTTPTIPTTLLIQRNSAFLVFGFFVVDFSACFSFFALGTQPIQPIQPAPANSAFLAAASTTYSASSASVLPLERHKPDLSAGAFSRCQVVALVKNSPLLQLYFSVVNILPFRRFIFVQQDHLLRQLSQLQQTPPCLALINYALLPSFHAT